MKARWWWVAPALAAAGYAQTESAISREGNYWVQTVPGSAPLEAAEQLRISTRGHAIVSGEPRTDIAYTLTKRVRAGDEQDARRAFTQSGVKITRQGAWVVLTVATPHGRDASAELRLKVPRSLRETEIRSEGGALEAHELDGGVRANTGGGAVAIDRIRGDVAVNTGGGSVRLGSIGGTVRCNSGGGSMTADSVGGEAWFNTGGGSISIREAKGQVHASTAGGNIRIERSGGPVAASTAAGSIDMIQPGGPVTAETSAGAIIVRSARGVRCESGGGTIRLFAVSGRLRAATGMGAILAELAGQSLEDSALSTGQGDITVYIPSNLAVTVQASNDSSGLRKIVSDFAEIRLRTESRGGAAEAQGSLNGGGPLLKLTASGGTIYLRRQK